MQVNIPVEDFQATVAELPRSIRNPEAKAYLLTLARLNEDQWLNIDNIRIDGIRRWSRILSHIEDLVNHDYLHYKRATIADERCIKFTWVRL